MALPTTYTETEVKEYMENVLGDTAHKLGWTVEGNDFDEPTNEVLYVLDLADFTSISSRAEAAKLRVVARMETWRAAMYYTVHESSHSAGAPGTGQTSRADIHRHAKGMFEMAKAEAFDKYPDLDTMSREAERWPASYKNDYYSNQDEIAGSTAKRDTINQ